MNLKDLHHSSLVFRVERLEARNRVWQIVCLLALLIFGVSQTANVKAQQNGAEPARNTTLEAQNFLLKDAAGTVMGRLTVKDGKAQLELYDLSGKVTWSTNTRTSILSQ